MRLDIESVKFVLAALKFPKIINVTVHSGECPCLCAHCPVGQVPFGKRSEIFGNPRAMDMKLFKKIADETAEHGINSAVRLHSVGEPLLWAELPQALAYCKQKCVQSWLFTSAVTRDRQMLEKICENGDIIEISVNSADREDYIRTKGIDAFDLVSENIAYMDAYIKKNNLSAKLLISRVQSDDGQKDKAFCKFWRSKKYASVKKDESVFIRTYHNYNGAIDEKSSSYAKKACLVHFARFSIDTDGTASVCMNEFFKGAIREDNGSYLGSINYQSIKEIWTGEKLSQIREADLHGRLNELGYEIPCSSCTYCQPLDTVNVTSESQLK